MADENADSPAKSESREPNLADLLQLCRELNLRHAKYIVVGGFAMAAVGYNRGTMDVDLLVETSLENESRVLEAVATLSDRAAAELKPGDIAQWTVVRIADEIVVDLMKSACGIDYPTAISSVEVRELEGVRIPFATPELLWRTKRSTHREKDASDLLFLKSLFTSQGKQPPAD